MAFNPRDLLISLAFGAASGSAVDAFFRRFASHFGAGSSTDWVNAEQKRVGWPNPESPLGVPDALLISIAILVALLPFLLGQGVSPNSLWLKAGWGEVFLLFSVIDLRSRRVPNELVLLFSALGLALSFAGFGPPPQSAIYGLVVGFFFFFILSILWRGGMGLGDVKFAAMSGAVVGFPDIFWALLWGLVAGGVVAAVLLLTRKASRKDKFPYVPPLAAGIWLYMLISM